MTCRLVSFAALLSLTLSGQSHARVDAVSDAGFVSRHEATVAASPDKVWQELLRPGRWWSSGHTYSGNAANMAIDPRAGGCFCERIPGKDGARAGQIEHMRVLYVAPGSALRMQGGLGPLQGEAVTGVLTVNIEAGEGGTQITWEYIVGGYAVASLRELAPLVDHVMREQFERLANRLDPVSTSAPALGL